MWQFFSFLKRLASPQVELGANHKNYPRLPQNRIIFVIADLHGNVPLLERAQNFIEERRDQCPWADITEIYLGDYIDKGADSRGVLENLLNRTKIRDCITLRGNHEDMLLQVVERRASLSRWLALGGDATLKSYGIDEALWVTDGLPEQLRTMLPAEHIHFLETMPYFYQEEGYIFVHAGLRPHRPLLHQMKEDLLWIRDEFLQHQGAFGGVVVHGHTAAMQPEFYKNRINLNIDSEHTGKLALLMIDDKNIETFLI